MSNDTTVKCNKCGSEITFDGDLPTDKSGFDGFYKTHSVDCTGTLPEGAEPWETVMPEVEPKLTQGVVRPVAPSDKKDAPTK